MAPTPGRWFSVVTLMDNGRNTTQKRYELNAADADEATTIQTALLAAVGGVTDCAISAYYTYQEIVESALVLPAAGVQVENLAQLDFDVLGAPNKSASHTIPGPKIGVFVATSGRGANVVNTAAPIVTAYRDLFISDPPSVFISDGETANTLIGGKRIHRASRRG